MKINRIIGILLTLLPLWAVAQSAKPIWKHRYEQTLVMKMFLSKPDGKGGSQVALKFEDALEIIKKVDRLSLQVPKIIYLVGWQYNGHDDQYPAFFAVNEKLKRSADAHARESLSWLIREAKKYHTTVSLHLNMTDAYEDSPLWDTYVRKGLISKTKNGKLKVIGTYNNRKAYHINYKREWESGWAQKRIDSLLWLIPELKDAGTIHLDAWIARDSEGHGENKALEIEYQQKVADYWLSKGIDATTEWVMDYMRGRVPYYWHFNRRTQQDYLDDPASLVTGGHLNPDLKQSEFDLEFLFGTSMYGEDVFPRQSAAIAQNGWVADFSRDFYLNFLQYAFLNRLTRLRVDGEGKSRVVHYDRDVQTSIGDSTVRQQEILLRDHNTVFFPIVWQAEKQIGLYSTKAQLLKRKLPKDWDGVHTVSLYKVNATGLQFVKDLSIAEGWCELKMDRGVPYLIKPKD